MAPTGDPREILERLGDVAQRAQTLQSEGLPFPTDQVSDAVREALAAGDLDRALSVVKRAESLCATASRDWTWVRELLRRVDELRALAQSIGVDLAHLDQRVGNAREQLSAAPLSGGSLEKAAASASLALAVLSDSIPKFCVQEGQRLGATIRSARDRGEDVTDSTISFRAFLSSIQEAHLPLMTTRLLEVRRAVGRIPREPAVATMPTDEEEDILLEARSLARRLHRIKGRARDASSAAKLMAEVRAALSEDRRYGTPEEEIEALWTEVDRLTKERQAGELAAGLPGEPAIASPALVGSPVESVPMDDAIPPGVAGVPPLDPPIAPILPIEPILPTEEGEVDSPKATIDDLPVETRRRARAGRTARP